MTTRTPRHKRLSVIALVAAALALAACGSDTATAVPAATTAAATTAAATTAAATTAAATTAAATTAAAATTGSATTAAATTAAMTATTGAMTAGTTMAMTPGTTTAAGSGTPAAMMTQDPNGKLGGTITVGYKSDFSSLDPQICYDIPCQGPVQSIFNGLLTYAPRSTQLVPDLATAMPTLSADNKTYTFTLKQGVKFSDGTVLKSSDVRYSIERNLVGDVQALGSGFNGFLEGITGATDFEKSQGDKGDKSVKSVSGIKTPDDYTISFTLDQPDQSFLNAITLAGLVVPQATVEKDWAADRKTNSFTDNPVGTGPYMVKTYDKGKTLTLVKNPNYSADKLGFSGYVDQLVFQLGVDEETQINRIKAGQMDYTEDGVPAADYPTLSADPQYMDQVIKTPVVDTDYIFMNTQMKPFDNKAVRQAFEYVFNKTKLLQLVNNRGTVAKGIFPPLMPGYNANLDTGYSYDPAKAKSLLQAAGFDFGQAITWWATDNDDDKKIVQQSIADLKAAGVTNVTGKFEKSGAFFKDIGKPNTAQMGDVGWFQDFPDPTDFIQPILSCATAQPGGSNAAFYCNKDVDTAEQAARGEPDPTKRLAAYQAIEKTIMADAPWVPYRNRINVDFNSKTLGGYYYHPALYVVFKQYWKTDGK